MKGHSPSIFTITMLFTNTVLTRMSKYSVMPALLEDGDYPPNHMLLQPHRSYIDITGV
jgi:hypothetical protein